MIGQVILVGFGVVAPLLFGFAVYVVVRGLRQVPAAAVAGETPRITTVAGDSLSTIDRSTHVSVDCGGHGGH